VRSGRGGSGRSGEGKDKGVGWGEEGGAKRALGRQERLRLFQVRKSAPLPLLSFSSFYLRPESRLAPAGGDVPIPPPLPFQPCHCPPPHPPNIPFPVLPPSFQPLTDCAPRLYKASRLYPLPYPDPFPPALALARHGHIQLRPSPVAKRAYYIPPLSGPLSSASL
jgi:hypothetical protein